MSLDDTALRGFSRQVDSAARDAQAIPQFPKGSFSLEDAYRIQRESIACRKERGERVVGIKLGFTSRAKMVQMGVHDLIWGWLTDRMLEEEGGSVSLSRYIHPRVEPEVCFLTRKDISGPLNGLEAVQYLEAVAPALEIIDSRYQDFRFSLEDVVADNCSSAGVVVGGWSTNFSELANAGVVMRFDGRVRQIGTTAAILGNPLRSIVQAARLLNEAECVLPAGSLIMAGAATAAEPISPGVQVDCEILGLGPVGFFVPEAFYG